MIKIAIVEDDPEQASLLEENIKRYAGEENLAVGVSIFYNVVNFLEKYTGEFDIVYMDIMMPMMNGMDAAHILREKDEKVILIFVTTMRQYAIQGYEVNASDYIIKPVKYPEFRLKFAKLVSRIRKTERPDIVLKTDTGLVRLTPDQILYVEVAGHHCVYHTESGDYRQYQTMKSAETALCGSGFARCNNFLLVNLAFVRGVDGMTAAVGNEKLQISHPRRKAFLAALTEFSETKKYV